MSSDLSNLQQVIVEVAICLRETVWIAGLATFATAILACIMAITLLASRSRGALGLVHTLALVLESLGPLLPTAALLALLPRLPISLLIIWLSLIRWPFICLPLVATAENGFSKTYVEAARTLGATHLRIFLVHLRVDLVRVLTTTSLTCFSGTFVVIAAVDFLGVGSVGAKTLGFYLAESFQILRQAPTAFVCGMLGLCGLVGLIAWLSSRIQRAIGGMGRSHASEHA